MNIILKSKNNKTYRITSDSRQYILSEERIIQKDSKVSKKGDKYYVEIAYIASLPGLFNKLIELNVRDSDAKVLGELKEAYNEVLEWLREEFKGEM